MARSRFPTATARTRPPAGLPPETAAGTRRRWRSGASALPEAWKRVQALTRPGSERVLHDDPREARSIGAPVRESLADLLGRCIVGALGEFFREAGIPCVLPRLHVRPGLLGILGTEV